jgi:hypothetical protein
MPPTAVVRHQAEKSGLAPLARSPCRIGYCAIPINRNDGLAALRYRNLMTRILPDGRAARTPSGQAAVLIPHRLARGRGTDVPRRPAVSSPEASRTPAARARGFVLQRQASKKP